MYVAKWTCTRQSLEERVGVGEFARACTGEIGQVLRWYCLMFERVEGVPKSETGSRKRNSTKVFLRGIRFL